MPSIEIAESAYLAAKARFERWKEEFENEWGAPHSSTVAALAARKLQKLPEQVQATSREVDPDAWKEVDGLAKIRPPEEV